MKFEYEDEYWLGECKAYICDGNLVFSSGFAIMQDGAIDQNFGFWPDAPGIEKRFYKDDSVTITF